MMYICRSCNARVEREGFKGLTGPFYNALELTGVIAGPRCVQGHYTVRASSFWIMFFTYFILSLLVISVLNIALSFSGIKVPFIAHGIWAFVGVINVYKGSRQSKMIEPQRTLGEMSLGIGFGMLASVGVLLALFFTFQNTLTKGNVPHLK